MAPTRPADLPAITGLRFVAALHVFAFHVLLPRLEGQDAAPWIVRLVERGYVGVSLFFVLSGFILAHVYLQPADAPGGAARAPLRGTAAEFWWARVARVFPLYLLGLAVSAPLFALTAWRELGAAPLSIAGTVLTAPFALQAWTPWTACRWNCPGWSLSVEALFYALFPLLGVALCRLSERRRVAIALATWGAGLALVALYLWLADPALVAAGRHATDPWAEWLKYAPPAHLGEFVAGVVVGLAFVRRRDAVPARRARHLAGGALVAVALLLAAGDAVPYLLLHNGLLVPLWCALLVGLTVPGSLTTRVLGLRPMTWLGERSYALYLLHLPIFAYLLAVAARVPAVGRLATLPWVALVLAVSLAASVAAHRWVELPARDALRRRMRPAGRAAGGEEPTAAALRPGYATRG